MKTRWIVIVFYIATLTACGSSANVAATATPFPTKTPFPTATSTATFTPSPTPDVRVIDTDPKTLLLQKTDLPTGGKYYLASGDQMSPVTNSQIVSAWPAEEGQTYLDETGRIHGWQAAYKRGTNSVRVPEEVHDNVVIFSDPAGAQLVVTKYGEEGLLEEGYKELDAPGIGDVSRAFRKEETNTKGATRVWLRFIFTYRNIYHTVELVGWQADVPTQFAVDTATKLVDALKQLPLSEAVKFTP